MFPEVSAIPLQGAGSEFPLIGFPESSASFFPKLLSDNFQRYLQHLFGVRCNEIWVDPAMHSIGFSRRVLGWYPRRFSVTVRYIFSRDLRDEFSRRGVAGAGLATIGCWWTRVFGSTCSSKSSYGPPRVAEYRNETASS